VDADDLRTWRLGVQIDLLEANLPDGELDGVEVEQLIDADHGLIGLAAPGSPGTGGPVYVLSDDLSTTIRSRCIVPGVAYAVTAFRGGAEVWAGYMGAAPG
jgi:hypothetical protein